MEFLGAFSEFLYIQSLTTAIKSRKIFYNTQSFVTPTKILYSIIKISNLDIQYIHLIYARPKKIRHETFLFRKIKKVITNDKCLFAAGLFHALYFISNRRETFFSLQRENIWEWSCFEALAFQTTSKLELLLGEKYFASALT